jgi:hypothetical protein
MARPETKKYEPLYSFTLKDGTPVEVRDGSCPIISRGSWKVDEFEEKRDRVCEQLLESWILKKLWIPGQPFSINKFPELKSPSVFARALQLNGLVDVDKDDSSTRKTLYPKVLKFFKQCETALSENAEN